MCLRNIHLKSSYQGDRLDLKCSHLKRNCLKSIIRQAVTSKVVVCEDIRDESISIHMLAYFASLQTQGISW